MFNFQTHKEGKWNKSKIKCNPRKGKKKTNTENVPISPNTSNIVNVYVFLYAPTNMASNYIKQKRGGKGIEP